MVDEEEDGKENENDESDKSSKSKSQKTEEGVLAVITDLCNFGNLEDFMDKEGVPLSTAVRLDLMLQVAEGLEQLKDARILWRDLKAKNLLVSEVYRDRSGSVSKLTIKFTDWGTAVKMPKADETKRRMTLHGPGTAGYIAPDTRGPMYDYQADMWAFLVWAASMCLRVECICDCQLEEALATLKLEKKANATAGHEQKVEQILNSFLTDGKLDDGCDELFELVKTSAPWVDATLRWTPDEAVEELSTFREDHGLVCEPGVRHVPVRRRSMNVTEQVKEKGTVSTQDTTVEETEDGVTQTEVTGTVEPEEVTVEAAEAIVQDAPVPVTALALVIEAAASRRAAAKELRARAEQLKAEAERLEAEAEAACAEDDDDFEDENVNRRDVVTNCSVDDDSPRQKAAQMEAASASAQWVGRRVRKWFASDSSGQQANLQNSKKQKSMLRMKRAVKKKPSGNFFVGVIVKTRAVRLEETAVWTTVCHVKYTDGEEDELTLGEVEQFVKAFDDFVGTDTQCEDVGGDKSMDTFTEAIAPTEAVDEDAVTEPVGSVFCRGRGTANRNSRMSQKNDTAQTSTRSRARRPVLRVLSSNDVADQHEETAGKRTKRNAGKPRKFADVQELHRIDEPSVLPTETMHTPGTSDDPSSGTSKRRGRRAPDWAVTAVEVMGVVLGCAKCRQSKYGCGSCRERNGISDPENPLVLALPSPMDATEVTQKSTKKRKARDRPSVSAAQLAVKSSYTKSKKQKKEKVLKNVGDISDVTSVKELMKRLPRGVTLGCSKCRMAWRGCGACRKAAGVWIAPSQSWVTRGASSSPPGAALALPAP